MNTKAGGQKMKATMLAKYGPDYFKRVGALGGGAPTDKPRGFAYLKNNGQLDKVRQAGRVGGSKSKRKVTDE